MQIIRCVHGEITHNTHFARKRIIVVSRVPLNGQFHLLLNIRFVAEPFNQNVLNQLVCVDKFPTLLW
jgi:hypothetical protein